MTESLGGSALSFSDAVAQGAVSVEDGATIDTGVFVVVKEDDGSEHGPVVIRSGARIRAGAVLCTGAVIGERAIVGHHVVVRRRVQIGKRTVISHGVCLERDSRIGDDVRISALTHITGATLIEDGVQIGARVATVNDKDMAWRDSPALIPPKFRANCRVGSGVVVLSGVEIGEGAFVGAGAVVTKDIPPNVVAWGTPAYVRREI